MLARPKATAYVHLYLPVHNAGGETTLHDMLRAMVQDGWEVDVILSREMPGYRDPYEVDGVNVFPFEDKRQIIRAANKSNLLITHLENSERTGVIGRRWRVPVVHLIHNNMDITKGYLGFGCDLAVFNTDWVREDFQNRPLKGSRSYTGLQTVVHPRVDMGRYPYDPQILKESEYITLVNLWDGQKGYGNGKGAHVFYEMAKRFPGKKFLGVLGGYGEQVVEDLPNVTIVPHTPDIVENVYSKTRILLMPSRYESFGRVAIEGASQGIPTIASPTPGLMEALGGANRYADPDDYDEWEAHIKALDGKRNYTNASRYALSRAKYWAEKQPEELETFLRMSRRIAETGYMLRGW